MSITDNSIPVSVVVQTHWDREWYLTHQSFIARLLHVMDKVCAQLESGQLHSFMFDGQTAALEDLLANCEPKLAARVRRLAADKRIMLGPWYVMADQFLCSGEALMRNLEIGIADAEASGNCQRVGYLPDTFGHISQMPQMLRHFGIGSAVMWRGTDSADSEFDWHAPDGSVAGTVFLTQGYYQHPFNVEQWRASLTAYLDQVRPRSLGGPLLLTQGGDHLAPNEALAGRIAAYNGAQQQYHLEQSTLEAYVGGALAASAGRRQAVHGELRQNAQVFVLPDVLSTRRYLKRLNQAAEDKLIGVVEPLLAQLASSGDYPAAYLEQTWRLLLQQQAHDSICGCSIDAVHDEMVTRYALLDDRMDALIERASAGAGLIALSLHDGHAQGPFGDDSSFTLFNPLPKTIDDWHEHALFLKGEAATALSIAGPSGEAIEHAVLAVAPHSILRSPLDDFPDRIEGHLYQIALRCGLKGMAALACTAASAAAAPDQAPLAAAIENAFMRIALDDGELTWTDKASGETVHAPLAIYSELDAGDSYNFSPPPARQGTLQTRFTFESAVDHGAVQELNLKIEMRVPAGLDAQRGGADGATVLNTGTLRLRLWQHSDMADCRLDWHNQARDQRTRLLLPLSGQVASTGSDSAFSWEQRPVVYAQYPALPSRTEMPVAVNPTYSAVMAGTLAFCHRAMQEYEVIRQAGRQYLGVTMVRSVGWLSRRDLVTRGVGAGPDIATPGAQCIGHERFEFRFGRAGAPEQVLSNAQALRRPPVLLRGHSANWRAPVEVGAGALQFSALRIRGDAQELRVWNPTTAPLALDLGETGWVRVLDDDNALIKPHAIATFRRPV
ncbi:glycoside hydrolase family 38 [Massilia glaciei]|uniref:Glycoside hydrolase family 38 n=1 Tax=Massilia glaciei TaxID=1524097 RepID=A0A2U2HFA0_9BURK|nr:glycoside hydrolase family 38 [Massilia glaciei]PWF42718.1 glycoside hydrolase family 38 [Massilia glaciei]